MDVMRSEANSQSFQQTLRPKVKRIGNDVRTGDSPHLYHLVVTIFKDFACLEAEKDTRLQIHLLKEVIDNASKIYSIYAVGSGPPSMEQESFRLVVEVVGQLVFVQNLNKMHQRILRMVKRLPDSLKAVIKEYWIERLAVVESDTVEISKLQAGQSFLWSKDFEDVHHVCSLQIWKRCISILELIKQDETLQHVYGRDFDIDLCKEAASGLIAGYEYSVEAEEYDGLIVRSYIAILDLLQVKMLANASSIVLGLALCKIVSKEQELSGMADILSGIFGSSSKNILTLSQYLPSESRIPSQALPIGQSQEVAYSLKDCVSNLPREKGVVILRGIFPALYEYLSQKSQSQAVQNVASRVMVALLLDTCQLMASCQTEIEVVFHCLAALNSGLEYFLRDLQSKWLDLVVSSENLKIMAQVLLPFTDAHDSSISFASQTALDNLLQISKLQGELDHNCFSAYFMKQVKNFNFHTKSKYRCTTSLLSKHGDLHRVLQLEDAPNLVNETLVAISKNASIATSASIMLRAIWGKLYFNRATVQSQIVSDLIDEETSAKILYQITEALLSDDVELKKAVNCYALPGLASEAPLALEKTLKMLLSRSNSLKMVSACTPILLRGRNSNLFFIFDDIVLEKTVYELINRGMESLDESAQRDALNFVSMNLKSTVMPTARDLHLIWKYFNISFRFTDTALRQESLVCLGKFILWIKISVAAVVTRPKDFTCQDQESLRLCEAWIQSMCSLCLQNMHPDSAYGKKFTAIEALCLILDAFGEFLHSPESAPQNLYSHSTDSSRKSPILKSMSKGNEIGKGLKYGLFNPFPASLFQRSTCRLLFKSMFDPWERVRESTSPILLMFPSPLPAFETAEEIKEAFLYLFNKLSSPRMTDSDAAARLITIFFRKYVIDLGWCIRVRAKCSFVVDKSSNDALNPLYFFCDILACAQSAGDISDKFHVEENFAQKEFAYGYLVIIQYMLPFVPFSGIKSPCLDTMNPSIVSKKLEDLLIGIYNQCMPILSVPEENYTKLMDSVPVSEHSLMDALDCKIRSEQLTLCASWMQSKAFCDILDTMWHLKKQGSDIPLSLDKDLLKWGNLVVTMLLDAKHYGTLDKAKSLFSTLLNVAGSDRKLSQGDFKQEISVLWMKIFLEHMKRPNQARRDAVRRSGGIPFGIHCIISANCGKIMSESLVECTINELISIASGAQLETDQHWPRIHAINTLRVVFADTKLTAIEFYCQKVLKVVLCSLKDPCWEVRNSASLCLKVLITRMMEISNIARIEHVDVWPRKSKTANEFFKANGDLDCFIREQCLEIAIVGSNPQIWDTNTFLAPTLAILSRLRPLCWDQGGQPVSSNVCYDYKRYGDLLSRCSGAPQIAIRKLASRSIVSVLPYGIWHGTCNTIARSVVSFLEALEDTSKDESYWNVLHGKVLQLLEFLKALESFKSELSKAEVEKQIEVIVSDVADIMLDWNVGTMQICPPVCADIMKLCLVIWRLEGKEKRSSSFKTVEKFCLATWKHYSGKMSSSDETLRAPMVPILLRRLVRLKYLIALTQDQESGKRQTATNCLRDCLTSGGSVDVQQAVLKVFLKTFATTYLEFSLEDLEKINSTFAQAVYTQRNQYIVSLSMKAINAIYNTCKEFCESPIFVGPNQEDLFKAAVYNNFHSLDPEIASESLNLASNLLRTSKPIFLFSEVLDAIDLGSLPDKMDDMRMSSAKSLAILNVFLPSKVYYEGREAICQFESIRKSILDIPVSQYLQIWTICLRLLEDEEIEIRSMLAKCICIAMPEFLANDSEFAVQPRPEYLQELIFSKLESILAPCLAEYASHLVTWTCNIAKCKQRMMESLVLDPDTQLFENEKDNQYEDPLILTNLSAHHLSMVLRKVTIANTCIAWLEESLGCIVNFSEELSLYHGTNTEDIIENLYVSLYSAIALAWAVSHGIPADHIKGPEHERLYQLFKKFQAIFDSKAQQVTSVSNIFSERGIFEASFQAISRIRLCFSHDQATVTDFNESIEFPMYPRVHFR
eukprot:jgi/Picsp_1/385/NSC_00383-R1_thyroid adenoma-associated protein